MINNMDEQEMLQQIADTQAAYVAAQQQMRDAKKAFTEAESLVVEHKIRLENLREQLRQYKRNTPTSILTLEEEDLERFREVLPELLKKV
jgi:phage-related minor tail protein